MQATVMVVMGSRSDWETMKSCADTLKMLHINYHCEVVSAHRTPEKMYQFAKNARDNGTKIIIAGAGGAAHLPGMIAASTSLPVIGVPIKSQNLNGLDSLFSIAQMPKGVSVATMSIGKSGAINAAIMAASILSLESTETLQHLESYRKNQTEEVLSNATLE